MAIILSFLPLLSLSFVLLEGGGEEGRSSKSFAAPINP